MITTCMYWTYIQYVQHSSEGTAHCSHAAAAQCPGVVRYFNTHVRGQGSEVRGQRSESREQRSYCVLGTNVGINTCTAPSLPRPHSSGTPHRKFAGTATSSILGLLSLRSAMILTNSPTDFTPPRRGLLDFSPPMVERRRPWMGGEGV